MFNFAILKRRFITHENLKYVFQSYFFNCFRPVLFFPFILAFVAASHQGFGHDASAVCQYWPGPLLWHNLKIVLIQGIASTGGQPSMALVINSLIMALLIATGKIILALCCAFALVYFNMPFKKLLFALIFSTMMLPVEVRIIPTFQVVASFRWLNTFSGLTFL